MKGLSKSLPKRWAMVNGGVVYEIVSKQPKDLNCAVEITVDNCPKVTVTKDGVSEVLYMNAYIEDGDTYTNDNFKKTVHGEGGAGCKTVEFTAYYKSLCEEQIANTITQTLEYDYTDYSRNPGLLGVPEWVVDSSYTVDPTDVQIDFSEKYYDKAKKDKVAELAMEAAVKVANRYGYDVSTEKLELTEQGTEQGAEDGTETQETDGGQ